MKDKWFVDGSEDVYYVGNRCEDNYESVLRLFYNKRLELDEFLYVLKRNYERQGKDFYSIFTEELTTQLLSSTCTEIGSCKLCKNYNCDQNMCNITNAEIETEEEPCKFFKQLEE